MARPRDASIDEAVVRACVELLGEIGRSGLSRAKVAERAGVSLPAVVRRYQSVDELLVAVAERPGSADESIALPAPTSLREFLVRSLLSQARAFRAPAVRRAASEVVAAAAGSPEVDRAFRETLRDQRAEGLRWVVRAKEEGTVGPDVDGELLLDTVNGASYYRLMWRGLAITEDEVEQIVDQVLGGVLSP
jgi:AcrR family transcriptional regulator